MGEKETGDQARTNLNSSKSNRTAADDPEGDDASDAERSGVATGAGAARLSTNLTIERQTPKRDFGD